jgi:hypothetical protein
MSLFRVGSNGAAAKQFFKRLLRSSGGEPRTIVTDRLASYKVAQRELMPTVHHNTSKYANNRAEQSHESTRFRERGMRRFKSPSQAQLFLTNHAAVSNLFNLGRHLTSASHYRRSRTAAFATWSAVVSLVSVKSQKCFRSNPSLLRSKPHKYCIPSLQAITNLHRKSQESTRFCHPLFRICARL